LFKILKKYIVQYYIIELTEDRKEKKKARNENDEKNKKAHS
jgi:hypothetical protein